MHQGKRWTAIGTLLLIPGLADAVPTVPVHGFVSTPYTLRLRGDAQDQDLYTLGSVSVGDPDRHFASGHAFARMSADLDGDQTGTAHDPFASIADGFDRPMDLRLYAAWIEGHRLPHLSVLRAGRQSLWETPAFVWFDGGRVETQESLPALRISAGGFLGRPVHLYQNDRAGDLATGAFVQARPRFGLKARADWMFFDEAQWPGDPENHLLAFRAWQRLGRAGLLHGAFTHLDGNPRDLLVRGTWRDDGLDMVLQASWFVLLRTQRTLAAELDPYSLLGWEERRYHRVTALASKTFAEALTVEAGYDGRRLAPDVEPGEFNREYDRYYGVMTLRDLLLRGTSVGINGDLWESGRRFFAGVGGELGWRRRHVASAAIGTHYRLYEHDLFAVIEREDVQTWYARVKAHGPGGLEGEVRYALEDAEAEVFHTLRLRATWRF